MDNGADRHSKTKSPVAGLISFIYFHGALFKSAARRRQREAAARWVLIGRTLRRPFVVWRDRGTGG